VADEHRSGRLQPRPDVGVGLRAQRHRAARSGERLAGDRVEVLQPDRHATQRRRRRTLGQPRVGPRGGGDGVLLVQPDPRVHGIRAPVEGRLPVLGDLGEVRSERLAGGKRAVRQRL
jgi:hypothetical protein